MSGKQKSVLAACLLFAIFYGSMAAAQPTPRIVGGTAVPDDRYPFMAAIFSEANGEIDFYPRCAGTVVGSRWILTAAHCVVNELTGEQISASEFRVAVGARDLNDVNRGALLVAENIYVHPDYDSRLVLSDIALIELSEAVSTPVLSLPAAGSDVPIVDEVANALGWGFINADFDESPLLQEVAIPIVAYSRCLPFYVDPSFQLQLDGNVCAGGVVSEGRNLCRGDSGGPLFVERAGLWVQAGVASYSNGCPRPNIPTVFTRVSNYADWVAGFVPDLQINNGGSGMVDGPRVLDESAVVALSADMPTDSGNLSQGEFAIYEVTGATRVDLRSSTGDGDLLIFTGTTIEASAVVCNSKNMQTPLDSCELPSTSQRVFAIVYIYDDSTYDIRAVGFETETIRPTVSGNTISWPDDGWYQVQRVTDEGIVEVCAGGRSCEVTAGNYIVINHTTGVRFENITVDGDVSESAVNVSGNTISWPDDGWYQVQRVTDEGIVEVCAGGRSCEVTAGNYIVINHTTGVRFENITVDGDVSESAVNVSGNTISWPDDGWYQVQRVTDEGIVEVCAGGRSCEVTAGNYIVINHTTGQRFEPVIVNLNSAPTDSGNVDQTAAESDQKFIHTSEKRL